jgi:hypothetical protein
VLIIHGGSFDAGSPFQANVEQVAEIISNKGYWVFVGDYRLAPCGRIYPNQPPHVTPSPTPTAFPTPTPNPSGRPPEQTDDVMSEMIAVRNSAHCNGKVGLVGVSSGGCISAYVALYRGTINGAGRPAWTGGNGDGSTPDLRPDCVVTFSSPFDLSDQLEADLVDYPVFIQSIQSYVGTCNRITARDDSPIALVDSETAANFKPMYMVHCDKDTVCPYRQLADIDTALLHVGVCSDDFTLAAVPEPLGNSGHSYGNDDHALALWSAPDPNDPGVPPQTVGQAVLNFLDTNLR